MRAARWILRGSLLGLLAAPLAAQDEAAIVGFLGLMQTPIGALAPMAPRATVGEGRAPSIGIRSGFWSFGPGDDETTNLGVAIRFAAGRSDLGLDVVRTSNKQCSECGGTMLGLDLARTIRKIEFAGGLPSFVSVGVNPAFGMRSEDGNTAMSLTLSAPIAAHLMLRERWRISPFIAPGYGFTRFSGAGESTSGRRATVGGGVGISDARETVQLSVGFRKVLLENAPTTTGIGLSWRPR